MRLPRVCRRSARESAEAFVMIEVRQRGAPRSRETDRLHLLGVIAIPVTDLRAYKEAWGIVLGLAGQDRGDVDRNEDPLDRDTTQEAR